MQIIINQAQIEEAINQYMLKKINLNSGSAFEIEIAATRGAGGFTATINIVEDAPKGIPSGPVKRTLTEQAKTATVIPKPQNVATENQKELPLEEDVPEVSASPNVVEEYPVQQPEEVAENATPVKRQLFGSLTKPVNS